MAQLEQMTTPTLRDRFERLFGYRSHSHNRKWLIRRIAWKLQEREYGGLSDRARRRAEELAATADLRTHPPRGGWSTGAPATATRGTARQASRHNDSRLPRPGTALTRRYRDELIEVTVLEDGFEYRGKIYRSLTAVAEAVTGSHWNGWAFFGLRKGKS
jgi:hypothetical protein